MASNTERLERAREIVEKHQIAGLSYMTENPLAPDSDTTPERYMVITHTDHSCGSGDAWLEVVDTPDAVLGQITHLCRDEWGLTGVWDLDRDDYLTPLPVTVSVSVEMPGETMPPRDLTIQC